MNTLRSALDAARREYNQSAPEAIALALRLEWQKKRQRKRRQRWGMGAIAATAATVCLIVWPHRQANGPTPQPAPVRLAVVVPPPPKFSAVALTQAPSIQIPRHHSRIAMRSLKRRPDAVPEASEFVAIPYSAPFLATDQIDIYRVQVPRVTLASYGMPMQPNSLNATVTADLLVGSDGIARAVRFVR
jgi:hypothetical protein